MEASEFFLVVNQVFVRAPVDIATFSFDENHSMTVDFSLSISVQFYFEFHDFIDNKI